ncbi:MAG: GHMP kinase [Planctomycetes bacterium]|nr:GHMP kinase [Planctomycetota bacterium]
MNHFVPSREPDEGLGALLLFRLIDECVPDFFAPDRPILVTRAPGRLDVMGGIADYSGSLVLQLPLAEAACVAVQARGDDMLRVFSPCRDGSRSQVIGWRLEDLGLTQEPLPYETARALFAAEPRDRWVAYVLGCLLVLGREKGVKFPHGVTLLLRSDVPEAKGISSSAAIEVASMRALATLYGVPLDGRELAMLCQKVENEVAGAPCGVMDQMTAACGRANELLALRCQPAEVEGFVPLPATLEVVGIDSGVRHAVSGSDYGAVRTGAFMGRRILAELGSALPWLADHDAAEFRSRWADRLPEAMAGADFLARHGGHGDAATRIDAARTYAVRQPTAHPIEENARVRRFRELLTAAPEPALLRELGDLMFASHASYSACGLGNDVTDFLVDEVRQRRERGAAVYGAKITGGGSGGTVAVLGERTKVWHEALRIKKALLQRTGHSAEIFRWSSPGAMAFEPIVLTPRE